MRRQDVLAKTPSATSLNSLACSPGQPTLEAVEADAASAVRSRDLSGRAVALVSITTCCATVTIATGDAALQHASAELLREFAREALIIEMMRLTSPITPNTSSTSARCLISMDRWQGRRGAAAFEQLKADAAEFRAALALGG